MKTSYSIGACNVTGEGSGESFLVSENGSYLFLGSGNSRYQGWHMFNGDMFKILEGIEIDGEVSEFVHEGTCLKRKKNCVEKYGVFGNSLVYSLSKENSARLVFDIRRSYDLSDDKQEYSFELKKDMLIVRYSKNGKNIMNIVVSGVKSLRDYDRWEERNYSVDAARGSDPSSRWVYLLGEVTCKRLIITAHTDEEKALLENASLVKKTLKKSSAKVTKRTLGKFMATQAVRSLTLSDGVFAGLPWFFQYWMRDEMISLGGALLVDKKKAKDVLLSRLHLVNDHGRLPNRIPGSDLGSADAIGWMAVRARQMIDEFSASEKKTVSLALTSAASSLIFKYHKNGFFLNKPLETWMDTSFEGDVRSGVRIEIQALSLALFETCYLLTGKEMYKKLEVSLAKNVRKYMFQNGVLYDGLNDSTQRPNIFLAHYAYPSLLSNDEWEQAFDFALSKLWLDWGGVSTIDKGSPLFSPVYTGENNKSYHRGDSWYWVNNYTALSLLRVNKKKYGSHVRKIKAASEKDLLWNGSMGTCSEVSSASSQTADGCLHQAWSSATFLELLKGK